MSLSQFKIYFQDVHIADLLTSTWTRRLAMVENYLAISECSGANQE